MALSPEEKLHLKSLKDQGKGKEELTQALIEYRSKKSPTTTPTASSQPKQQTSLPPLPPAKERSWGEFAGEVGNNLVRAPGAFIEGVGDTFSGKTAKKIGDLAPKAYDEIKTEYETASKSRPDIQKNYGLSYVKNKANPTLLDQAADVATKGMQEFGQFNIGAFSEIGRSAVNLAEFGTNALAAPTNWMADTAVGIRDSITGQTSVKPSERFAATQNLIYGGGRDAFNTLEDTASGVTGVPKESLSGGAGRFTGNVLGTNAISKGLVNLASKVAPQIVSAVGSANRAKSIFSAGASEVGNAAQAASAAEKASNFIQKVGYNVLKKSVKGGIDANVSTVLAEGRPADLTENVLASAAYGLGDMFGGMFQKKAIKDYRKSINLLQGVGDEMDSTKFINEKIPLAIQEGYIGGRDPLEYRNLARERIKAYSEVVDKTFAQNSDKALKAETFFEDAYEFARNKYLVDPEEGTKLLKGLDIISGRESQAAVKKLTADIGILKNQLKETQKAMVQKVGKKTTSIDSINTTRNQIISYAKQLRDLGEEKAKHLAILEVKNKPLLPSDIQQFKRTATEFNKGVVSGEKVVDATTEGTKKAWMLIRDSSEKTLNKMFPGLAEANERLNLAYRIDDAMEPLIRNTPVSSGTKEGNKAAAKMTSSTGSTFLPQGTRRVAVSQGIADTLKSPLVQRATSVAAVKSKKEAEKGVTQAVDYATKIGNNVGGFFTGLTRK